MLGHGKHFNLLLELTAMPVRAMLESQLFDCNFSLRLLIKSALHHRRSTFGDLLMRFRNCLLQTP
jgi:hypothetical protein